MKPYKSAKNSSTLCHKALAKWYAASGRKDLPWRNTSDPYHIWVSEIMLQQTQVKTVLERYYHPFLKRFPSIETLANASEQEVLKSWEGLGYYTRARNLHKAAMMVVEERGQNVRDSLERLQRKPPNTEDSNPKQGQFKNTWNLTPDTFISLPGIGKNTAHAILSLAFHLPYPVMEANVRRVLSRLYALKNPTENQLWDYAWEFLNRADPFTHNQAMMDLGALICTTKNPKCTACPLNTFCKGKKAPLTYGVKKVSVTTPTRNVIIVVEQNSEGEIFLERKKTKLLGGMYHFPQLTRSTPPKAARKLGLVKHAYSHFKLQATVYLVKKRTAKSKNFYTKNEIAELPLSKLDQKILALL